MNIETNGLYRVLRDKNGLVIGVRKVSQITHLLTGQSLRAHAEHHVLGLEKRRRNIIRWGE